MCGITGFLSPRLNDSECSSVIARMTSSLAHRGPDGASFWLDASARLGLGHRRLAILDLTPSGVQPMHSSCGRYCIVYNGEIYNHPAIRAGLADRGVCFHGNSDTETLLESISTFGLEHTLPILEGMFAFALWDQQEHQLHLVRDRLGIKPLYYWCDGTSLLFGSELKALRQHPECPVAMDRNILALYFRHNYIPAPYSILQGVQKLLPGEHLTFNSRSGSLSKSRYWTPTNTFKKDPHRWDHASPAQAERQLEALLTDAVRSHLLSDVPLGTLLSGGIDSSLVTALTKKVAGGNVQTFSVRFEEQAYDESVYARQVARLLGTSHTELTLRPEDLLESVHQLATIWDEPFSDSSQVPSLSLCRLVRQHVTVALSGDGGDECFLGYARYRWGNRWNQLKTIPPSLRSTLAQLGAKLPAAAWDALGPFGRKARWRLGLLRAKDFREFYHGLMSHWLTPSLLPGATEPTTPFTTPGYEMGNAETLKQMSYLDIQTYLPDDILTKLDRASMAWGLETRVPLLDHRVVEFAASLPAQWNYKNGKGKLMLRNILAHHLPRELFERPKSGFSVPIRQWLRHELRDWCESLLDEKRIREQHILDADLVRSIWTQYLNGRSEYSDHLWDVLMFQAWLDRWENGA